jgi:hypothetical protein
VLKGRFRRMLVSHTTMGFSHMHWNLEKIEAGPLLYYS